MIDYIIPYCDSSDKEWLESYKSIFKEEPADKERFRDLNVLKYQLRSIEKFAPYVRVLLVVSSMSQVPKWVNTKKIRIVLHSDFIDKEFLPTFNSHAIEFFLPNIPDLSERVIYSNDDLLFIRNTEESDFFKNGRPVHYYKLLRSRGCGGWQAFNWDQFTRSIELFGNEYELEYARPEHFATPYLLRDMKEVFNTLYPSVKDSLVYQLNSRRRNFESYLAQYSQYIYFNYEYLKGIDIHGNGLIGVYTEYKKNSLEIAFNAILNDKTKRLACINDSEVFDPNCESMVTSFLEKMFPNKSKYEL